MTPKLIWNDLKAYLIWTTFSFVLSVDIEMLLLIFLSANLSYKTARLFDLICFEMIYSVFISTKKTILISL